MKKLFLTIIVFSSLITYGENLVIQDSEIQKTDKNITKSSNTNISKEKQSIAYWKPYMIALERKIKSNWTPPKSDISKRVVVVFEIAKDGKLLSPKITKSSENKEADEAALKAIESATPFYPLPSEFNGESVPIEFTFDYNVMNNRDTLKAKKDNTSSIDSYTSILEQKINTKQNTLKNDIPKNAIAYFETSKNGNLLYSEITESSGSKSADNEILEIIKSLEPFDSFPKDYELPIFPIKLVYNFKSGTAKCSFANDNYKSNIKILLNNREINSDIRILLSSYIRHIDKTLKENWIPPSITVYGVKTGSTAKFDIDKDGTISNLNISTKSESKIFDDAVIKTFDKVKKFNPLPEAFENMQVSVFYTFPYRYSIQNKTN